MSKSSAKTTLLEFMRNYLQTASANYLRDIENAPKERLEDEPDAPKKAALDFLAECTEENLEIAHILRHEDFKSPCYAGFGEHHTIQEFEQLKAALKESAEQLLNAVEELGEDGLSEIVTCPDGESLPAYRLATRAANLMKYHDLYTDLSQTAGEA